MNRPADPWAVVAITDLPPDDDGWHVVSVDSLDAAKPLPAGVKPSDAGAGRGSADDPRRLDIPTPFANAPGRGGRAGMAVPTAPNEPDSILERPDPDLTAADIAARQRAIDDQDINDRRAATAVAASFAPQPESRVAGPKSVAGQAAGGALSGLTSQPAAAAFGLVRGAADAVGADSVAKWAQLSAQAAGEFTRRNMGDDPSAIARLGAGVASLAPLVFGDAAMGASWMGSEFGTRYNEAREMGFEPTEAAQRAGFGALTAGIALRYGIPAIESTFQQVAAQVPTSELGKAVAGSIMTNAGVGAGTSILNDLYDKFGVGGAQPDMSFGDMVSHMVGSAVDNGLVAAVTGTALPLALTAASRIERAAVARKYGPGLVELADRIDAAQPDPSAIDAWARNALSGSSALDTPAPIQLHEMPTTVLTAEQAAQIARQRGVSRSQPVADDIPPVGASITRPEPAAPLVQAESTPGAPPVPIGTEPAGALDTTGGNPGAAGVVPTDRQPQVSQPATLKPTSLGSEADSAAPAAPDSAPDHGRVGRPAEAARAVGQDVAQAPVPRPAPAAPGDIAQGSLASRARARLTLPAQAPTETPAEAPASPSDAPTFTTRGRALAWAVERRQTQHLTPVQYGDLWRLEPTGTAADAQQAPVATAGRPPVNAPIDKAVRRSQPAASPEARLTAGTKEQAATSEGSAKAVDLSRFVIEQITDPGAERGRWVVRDTARHDWTGQFKQIGQSFPNRDDATAALQRAAEKTRTAPPVQPEAPPTGRAEGSTERKSDANPEQWPLFQRGDEEANALRALSENDENFAYPKSDKTTVAGIAADIDPQIKVTPRNIPGEERYDLTMPDGKTARLVVRKPNPYGPTNYGFDSDSEGNMTNVVGERPGENAAHVPPDKEDVFIDASLLEPGGGGSKVYAIASAFAHNTGRVLIGDPAGLSDEAMRRRPEHMLSSALKFGTTDHLAPHPRQVVGDERLGVPPLRWVYGDHLGNIRRLIDLNLGAMKNAGADAITYDIPSGRFLDSEGQLLSRADLERLAETTNIGARAGAGGTTLARRAVLDALLRRSSEGVGGADGQRPGLLAQLEDLRSNPETSRLFYQRDAAERAPERSGLSADAARGTVADLTRSWRNAPPIQVIDSLADAPAAVQRENARQLALGARGSPSAFFLGGKVYVVADQMHTPDAVAQAVFHEALGHFGLRGVFGDALTPVLREVAALREADVRAKAKQYGLDYADDTHRLMAAEEVLADMAQEHPTTGIVQRAIAAIRAWLREHVPGLHGLSLSDSEIVARFIEPARRFVQEGPKASDDVEQSPAFNRATEIPSETTAEPDASGLTPDQLDSLKGREVSYDVHIEDVGKTARVTVDAARAIRYLGERIDALERGQPHELDRDGLSERVASYERAGMLPDDARRAATSDILAGLQGDRDDLVRMAREQHPDVFEDKAPYQSKFFEGDAAQRAALTDTPEFKKWFQGSKVTDEDGRPRVLYHGTDRDIERFEVSQKGHFGSGIYLTDQPHEANFYAESDEGGGNVMPVYAAMKNPFVFKGARFDKDGLASTGLLRAVLGEKKGKRWATTVSLTGPEFGDVLKNELEARGHDGLIVHFADPRDGNTEYIAFRPEQVKSAIGNAGSFDGSDPRIAFQRADDPDEPHDFQLRPFGKAARFLEINQDRYNRWKHAVEDVKKQGGTVTDENDFYRAEERYWGRVGARLETFGDEVRQFAKALQKDGLTLDDVAKYAYAQHAEERNAWIAERRADMPDGGSGMTNDEARAILEDARQAGLDKALTKYADTVRGWAKGTRDILRDGGLISADEHQAWDSMFKNYVPLRGRAGVIDAGPRSAGFNIRGPESKSALGRRSEATQIIENVVNDRVRALIRVGKNDVMRSFLQFVLDNPSPKLWEVNAVENRPTMRAGDDGDRYIEEVERPIMDGRTITVKDGGEEVHILVHDQKLLDQLRGANLNGNPSWAIGALHFVNRKLSHIYTSLSPTFTALNLARDVGTASFGIVDEVGLMGLPKLFAAMPKALYEGWRAEAGHPSSDYQQYVAMGGRTSFFNMKSLDDRARELEAMFDHEGRSSADPRRLIHAALRVIEGVNGGIENATRLAAFKVARDSGMSLVKAASVAKNITVNFNRKGTQQWASAWVLFYNPGVQDLATGLGRLRNPKVLGLLGTAMMGVAALAMRNAAMGDDDDGVAWWDKIPDDVKERNLVIVLPPGASAGTTVPGSKVGRYVKVPMPYFYAFFAAAANQVVDVWRHSNDPKRGRDLLGGVVKAFNAFTSSLSPVPELGRALSANSKTEAGKSLLLAAVPDALNPIAQNILNQNSFGRKMYPDDPRSRNLPDSQDYFAGQAGTIFQRSADLLNQTTGGSKYTSGLVDMTPASLENLVRTYGGGPVMFGMDLLNALYLRQSIERPQLDAKRLPFVKQVYGQIDDDTDRLAGEQRLADTEKTVEPIQAAIRAGDGPAARELFAQGGAVSRLGPIAQTTREKLAAIRKQELAVMNSTQHADLKFVRLAALEKERRQVMQQFTRVYDAAIESQTAQPSKGQPQQ